MTREQEIRQQVITEKNYRWDAYDQGRWAHATGLPRDHNPHIPGHDNSNRWLEGWDAEDNYVAPDGDSETATRFS